MKAPGFRKLGKLLKRAGALAFIGVVERTLFTRFAWPRRLAERALRDEIALIGPHLDAALYVRQIRAPLRRKRAARSPALHYALIGWREHRAPNATFDPRYYRQETPGLSLFDEPYSHFLRIGQKRGAAQNEVEAARRLFIQSVAPRRFALTLHHARGGGSSVFLAQYEASLVQCGVFPLRLRLISKSTPLVICEDETGNAHVFDLIAEQDRLLEFAREKGVSLLLVNHVIDMPQSVMSWLPAASRRLDAPMDVILHDYFSLCPRVNLIDSRGRFCGVAPPSRCIACVRSGGDETGGALAENWRRDFLDFLSGARGVIVPSQDMAQRMTPYIHAPITIWRPDDDTSMPRPRAKSLGADDPLRIAVIGAIDLAKGSGVVLDLARAIERSGAPLALTLIGSSDDDRRLRAAGATVTGRYRDADLPDLIAQADPHVVFLPSIWPETWSFVLTHALKAALPVVAFDIGAPAERLRALARGRDLLPYDMMDQPGRIMDAFLQRRAEAVRENESAMT